MTARLATHSQHLWPTPYGAAPPGDAQILAVPEDPKAAPNAASRPEAPPRSNQPALTPVPTPHSKTLHVPITSPRLGHTRPSLPVGLRRALSGAAPLPTLPARRAPRGRCRPAPGHPSPSPGPLAPDQPAGSRPHCPCPPLFLPLPTPRTRVAANPDPPPLSAPSTHPRFLQASRDSHPGGTPCY